MSEQVNCGYRPLSSRQKFSGPSYWTDGTLATACWASNDHAGHVPAVRAAELSPIMFMDADDRAFFDGLCEPVTVFRGCGKRHVRGMAWTTDPKIAEFFARGGRFPQPRDPVIATAEIDKSAVFFVTQSRNESEVVLDRYRVKRLRLEPFAQSEAA